MNVFSHRNSEWGQLHSQRMVLFRPTYFLRFLLPRRMLLHPNSYLLHFLRLLLPQRMMLFQPNPYFLRLHQGLDYFVVKQTLHLHLLLSYLVRFLVVYPPVGLLPH